MKKYSKPSLEIEIFKPNEVIAACGVRAAGWQNSWTRDPHGYGSYEEARAAHNSPEAPIFPIYYVEGRTSDGDNSSFYWEDQNSNGVYDGGDNLQDGRNHWWELDTVGLGVSGGNFTFAS